MFVGEAPGLPRGQAGRPVRRRRRAAARQAARGDRPQPRGRLHLQRAQVPAAREPRPAARGDRGLREPPLPPDRADRAAGGRDARQLRDQAPLGQARRDHPRPRPRAGGRRSAARACSSTRSSTPPPRSTPRGCSRCCEADFRAPARAARPRGRAPATAGRPRRRRPRASPSRGPARPLLSARRASRGELPPRPIVERGASRRLGAETEALGARLARALALGDVVARRRRARRRQDDLRPRRLPRARRHRAGDEPDLRDRPPLRGAPCRSRTSTSTGSPGSAAEEWGDLEPYFDGTITFVEWPEHARRLAPAARVRPSRSPTSTRAHREIRIDSDDDLRL